MVRQSYGCLVENRVLISIFRSNEMDIPIGSRQLLVAMSPQLAALSLGGCLTYPTVLMQQLKCSNCSSTIQIDKETATWIGAIYGLAGIPVVVMPLIMQWKGRKFSYIMSCMFLIIGWVLYLLSTNTTWILISESFHGLATNSLLPVSYLSLTEMIAPKYRSIAIQIFGLSVTLGLAVSGIMGRFLHFKTISFIMLVPITIAVVIAFLWPESPPWYACRGEFDKCQKAFLWLRGSDDLSLKELRELISAQRENLGRTRPKRKITCASLWTKVTSKDFYKPALHIFILLNMLYWSGVDFILIYIIEIVQTSAQSADAAFYASIVVYLMVFGGSLVTNVTIRKFKNKTVVLSSTCGVILCLAGACFVSYLQSVDIISKASLLPTYFLVGYIATAMLGLNAVVFIIAAELMPVKHRSLGGAMYIIFNCGLYASTLKISPYLLQYLKLWGTLLIFTVNAVLCSLFVWKYVPETKGRTLQEIEDFYMYGHFSERKLSDDSELIAKT